jgi:hypothetical protein
MYIDRTRQEQHRITDQDWDQGWRYELSDAIDYAMREEPDGTVWKIDIQVRKRGDNSFHDWLVSQGGS